MQPSDAGARPSDMTNSRSYSTRAAGVATALAALLTGAAGATLAIVAYAPAEPITRTVQLSPERATDADGNTGQDIARRGWNADSPAGHAKACDLLASDKGMSDTLARWDARGWTAALQSDILAELTVRCLNPDSLDA